MMKPMTFLGLSLCLVVHIAFCQNTGDYAKLIDEAYKLYQNGEYLKSGKKYAEAFVANGNKGLMDDRYNAACSWALANESDSAFVLLFMIAKKGQYADYEQLINDKDLNPLHLDSRWEEMISIVKSNKEKKKPITIKSSLPF